MNNREISGGAQSAGNAVTDRLPLEITRLVAQKKNRDRFSLFHNEIFLMGISTETLTRWDIKTGTICTPELYRRMQESEDIHAIRVSALRYLGRRAHAVQELEQKLRNKNYPQENITLVLEELTQKGWLDDLKFSEIYAGEKAGLKGWGPNKIKSSLIRKGISPHQAEKSLEIVMENLDLRQICVDLVMKKKSRFLREKEPYKRNQKIYRYLTGKGYSSQTITSVLPAILIKLDV